MNTLIIYKSIHQGNTKRVAEAMANKLNGDLAEPEEIRAEDLEGYDLIGFGSGIYFTDFHRQVLGFAEELNEMNKKAFIFSTSGMPKVPVIHDFEKKIKQRLDEAGFELLGSFNCRGFDDYGPLKYIGGIHKNRPNKNDLKEAREFVKRIGEGYNHE